MPDEQMIFEFVDGSRELIRKGTWRYWELIEDGHTPVGSVPESDGISDALEAYLSARFTASAEEASAGLAGRVDAVESEVEGRLSEPGLSATFAPRSAQVKALHADLAEGRDVDVIIHGDSTADATDEWFARAFDTLAAQYPAYDLHHRLWSDTNQRYEAPTVLQTGSGAARADGYAEFSATTGKYLSTLDSPAVSITGDIDIRVKVAFDDWTPAADQAMAAKFNFGGQRSWRFWIGTDGTPKFEWSTDGTTLIQKGATANMGSTPAGATRWLRVTLDVDNGAGGNDVRFYWSNDGVTWNQLGTTITTATATSIFDSAYPVEVGSRSLGGADAMAGKFYRLVMFADLAESDRRIDLDMNTYGGGGPSFTAYTGETWLVNGSLAVVPRAGAPLLTAWNGSASGRPSSYHSDATRFTKIAPPGRPVRLAFISHSHNENGTTVGFSAKWKALADLLLNRYPQAGMVAVLQNPRKAPAMWINEHAERLSQVRALAGRFRWDVLDAYTPLLADTATLVHTDGIHPSAAGQTAWTGIAEEYLGV